MPVSTQHEVELTLMEMSVQWLIVNQSLQQTFDLMMTGVEKVELTKVFTILAEGDMNVV